MQSNIVSNDLDSKEAGRNQRGYNFENTIKEVSLGLEFNFFDFNLHDSSTKITPYVHIGLSYFRYDALYVLDGKTEKIKNTGSFAVPMTVGIKSNIATNLILAAEVGARYTLTDNIDGSNPKNKNLESLRFGNINNNDWYVFSGVTLTYTFGNKPCYCAE
jgi:outer membrane protein W